MWSFLFISNHLQASGWELARPAVIESLKNEVLPENLTTAFAGNDVEAVARARENFAGYPPSSPCVGLFREGRLVHMIERHQIEGQSMENLTKILTSAYNKYCGEKVDESGEIYDPVAELQITVQEAKQLISSDSQPALLDVRQSAEVEAGKIEGSLMVDPELARQIVDTWARDREIIVYLRTWPEEPGGNTVLKAKRVSERSKPQRRVCALD